MKAVAEENVKMRPLRSEDAEPLSAAFAAIGWSKPVGTFTGYFAEQAEGLRWVRVVEADRQLAGYVTLLWVSSDPTLRSLGIPEIADLNVLPKFRRRGLGSALVAAAEAEAASRGSLVGLRVGLHAGYGAAQRLYVRRGYIPDGSGAASNGEVVEEGASVLLDDELTLCMIRELSHDRAESGST